ncbi:MAG: SBBP repeat-containing protein [candidate division Zixibacteria bacterium]|nr:SBBP repeat-containing protein [candidate division Zixibacteria bacterium]
MKNHNVLLAVMIVALVVFSTSAVASDQSITVTRNLTSMPLAFTENQGQWDEQVSFRTNAGGATMWFTKDGAVYQFTRTIRSEDNDPISVIDKRYLSGRQTPSSAPNLMHQPDSVESIEIKSNFVGSNPNPQMVGVEMMEYKCNYFIGNDPDKWHTDVPNYQAIVYEDVYAGIDLKFYGNGKQMEYDFIVLPGADPSEIMVQYEGTKSINVNERGELVVETDWGKVVEHKPHVYQVVDDIRELVECEYALVDDQTFCFCLPGGYDDQYALVIDPVLSYSTFLGGGPYDEDRGYGIAVDASGCAYVSGWTESSDFPTQNAYQTNQGYIDVFVTKLSSSGNDLLYSTYLGGSNVDVDKGYGIAVDGSGCAYVTGYTCSSDFPTTPNAYDTSYNGPGDVFVTKLSAAGNALTYSTYIGDSEWDVGWGVAVDGSGCAYVTGYTGSTDFPTENPYQTDPSPMEDAFVTKLNSSGDGLIYSTYLGASNWDDYAYAITVDSSGCAYVTGYTRSSEFPTLGEYQTYQGGMGDVFVTKLNSIGNGLLYSTFLGGEDFEEGWGIAVDGSGCAYVTGATYSSNFPTQNAIQAAQGGSDVFVTKLNESGNDLLYSTFLGSSGNDWGFGIAVDGSGCAYVTGDTQSPDFPVKNQYQTYQGGLGDAFVTKLASSGNSLLYSTYLGGCFVEQGHAIAVDTSGCAYVAGFTSSSNFPTENAYQADYAGGFDAFVTKICPSASSVEQEPGDIIPKAFLLQQNYPNPFNPTTTISFSVKSKSHVKITVYDVLGRQVVTLVDETLSCGNYNTKFDGANLASGVYLYELEADGFTESRKMVLAK